MIPYLKRRRTNRLRADYILKKALEKAKDNQIIVDISEPFKEIVIESILGENHDDSFEIRITPIYTKDI